jgi:hypothetical protein
MAELSLEGLFGIGEAIGIIAALFVILYFSRKQMQSLSVDIQIWLLNISFTSYDILYSRGRRF